VKLIDPRITMLFSDGGLNIEVHDSTSGTPFLEIQLNQEQACRALSRCGWTECSAEVRGLDRVGLYMEMAPFVFEFDDTNIDYKQKKEIAADFAESIAPEGWKPDRYFGSQGSFFQVDGVKYARTTLRRYVKEKDPEFGLRKFGVTFPEPEPVTTKRKVRR
jgi:hypothetical protein